LAIRRQDPTTGKRLGGGKAARKKAAEKAAEKKAVRTAKATDRRFARTARSLMASQSVRQARIRRIAKAGRKAAEVEWFIKEVSDKIAHTIKQRVRIATELVHSKMIRNISRPVGKSIGPRGGRVITGRSEPGEFPKAETTHLMKTLFKIFEAVGPKDYRGYVGTPLSYGLILETKRNRSFLKRTLNEERSKVMRILSGPIK